MKLGLLYIALLLRCISFAQAESDTDIIVNESEQAVYGQSHIKSLESAKRSQKKLESLYQHLIKNIRHHPDIVDDEHKNSMLIWLEKTQQNWSEYAYSHCMFLSYAYAYPSTSRLASVEFNVCKTSMNIQRITFFKDMLLEYAIEKGE